MTYLDTNARTTKPTLPEKFNTLGRFPTHTGVFMGYVKQVDDIQRTGRLRVWVPDFGSAPEDENGWITASYCSPFAGATNVETTSKTDLESFEKTQTSYGLWMVPPDINNHVLIMFISGDPSKAIWIGSLYDQFMNNMVPGMATDVKNYQWPGKNIPVAEYNKWDKKVTHPDRAIHPYEKTKFRGIGNQGLITDRTRGVTTSGARRESPSKVFGIVTPGPPVNPDAAPENIRRKGGSALIMDDGTDTEYVQLTTKTGAQIRLDETNGFVYLINRDGTAWVQMDQSGNIDIFGARDISMRAQRDINIRGDRNVNIEAGQNVYISAAKDTKETTIPFTHDINNKPRAGSMPLWKYVGRASGDGGNIVLEAQNNWHSTARNSAFLSVLTNNMDIAVNNNFRLSTNGGQDYFSKQGVKLTTQASLDISVAGNIRAGAGQTISVIGNTGVIICSNDQVTLKTAGAVDIASGSDTSISASQLSVSAYTNIGAGLNVTGEITANHVTSSYSDGGASAGPSLPALVPPESAIPASVSVQAEIKPLNTKVNVLATWADMLEPKFKRDTHNWSTIVSRFPTFEPCPEHELFGSKPATMLPVSLSEADKTYSGSSGPANTAKTSPPAATTQGAANKDIKPDPVSDSSISKEININALRCQLTIHEGRKNKVYNDSVGLPTAGIGHLLRQNERAQFPVGSTVTDEQVEQWYSQDSASAIAIAKNQMGPAWDNLSDVRKRAVVDLAYNLGPSGLAKFVKFTAAMKAGDHAAAGQELKDSAWYNQVGRRGPAIVSMITNNVDPHGCDAKFKQ